MGVIKPFPRVRNRPFVLKHAGNVAAMSAEAGDKYLANQLAVQSATMARRGIAQDLINAETKSLEMAIRAELWRLVLAPGGAA